MQSRLSRIWLTRCVSMSLYGASPRCDRLQRETAGFLQTRGRRSLGESHGSLTLPYYYNRWLFVVMIQNTYQKKIFQIVFISHNYWSSRCQQRCCGIAARKDSRGDDGIRLGWHQAGEGTKPRACSRVCQLEPALGELGRFRSRLGMQVNNLTCWSNKANCSSIGVVLKNIRCGRL